MKSFLIVGMGSFGHHLCKCLSRQKCEIMIVDSDESVLEDMLPYVVSAKVGDCTNIEVLRSFGIDQFDTCFVCIGGNFQNSLEVTSLLKELGAKKVLSKANEDIQAKFLLRNGADEVIYPEQDVARNIAVSESNDSIFDCIELTPDHAIYEIRVPESWIGKSIVGLNIRQSFRLNVLAVKNGESLNMMPGPDYVFRKNDHPLVMGHRDDLQKVSQD